MERSQKPSIVRHRDFPFVLIGFFVTAGFLFASGWFRSGLSNNQFQLDSQTYTNAYNKLSSASSFSALALIPAAAVSLGTLRLSHRKNLWILPLVLTFAVLLPSVIGFVQHNNSQTDLARAYAPKRAALAQIYNSRQPSPVVANQLSKSGVQWVQAVQTLPGDQARNACDDLKVSFANFSGQLVAADAAISCRMQAKVNGSQLDAYVRYDFAALSSTTEIVYVADIPADAKTSSFNPLAN